MSRIDELIESLCPDGVPFKSLGDCILSNTGGGTPSKASPEFWNGEIPWASVGDITSSTLKLASTRQSITSLGLQNSSSHVIQPGSVVVAIKMSPGAMRVVVEPVAINQDIRGLVLQPDLDPYFLTYFFTTLSIVGNGTIVRSITSSELEKIKVPVPPLEVQQEIVRILDQFTQLEAELEAELEARRAQYEVLRNLLFARAVPPTEWNLLEETGTFERGSSLQKKDFVDSGVPCLHYGEIYTHFGVSARKSKSYVTEAFAKGKRFVEPGDVFIATTSENVNDLGKAVAWLADDRAVASNDAIIYRGTVEPRYVSHFLRSEHFQMQKLKFITGTKVMRLSAKALGSTLIPIPDQSIQASIADTLDKFEALINDLSVGLPAELNARRKQYEYYRDKLLTFKELAA